MEGKNFEDVEYILSLYGGSEKMCKTDESNKNKEEFPEFKMKRNEKQEDM